jgi:hypothetical protein
VLNIHISGIFVESIDLRDAMEINPFVVHVFALIEAKIVNTQTIKAVLALGF